MRYSDALIADAQGIADYYTEEFNAPTVLLAYGAPRISADTSRLAELDLSPKGFHLVVARFEVENHVDVIVEGYVRSGATLPLVVVGSAPYADDYTARIESLADGRVRLLGGLWDQDLLDALYSGALVYFHGHSVGGTNPSLLRAIGAGAAVDAFDVSFNREVLGEAGRYWTTPDEVAALVVSAESDVEAQTARGEESRKRAALYDWDEVASGYEALARRLALEGPVRRRPSGRRTGKAGWWAGAGRPAPAPVPSESSWPTPPPTCTARTGSWWRPFTDSSRPATRSSWPCPRTAPWWRCCATPAPAWPSCPSRSCARPC